MAHPRSALRTGAPGLDDERRAWLRRDDRLLLEYRKAGATEETEPAGADPPADAAIAHFIANSTASLLARIQQGGGDPTLVPWLMKIDWTLELMLKTLARMAPDAVPVPQPTDVNLGAGGLRFTTDQPVDAHDHLRVNLILPPFTPIHATAEILRVRPVEERRGLFDVATRFVELAPDDRERIVRHVFSLDAARLRGRHEPDPDLLPR
jgi:PilZ domain